MSSTLKTPQSHTTTGWEFLLIFFFKPNFAENFSSCHCFFLSRRRLDTVSDITLRSWDPGYLEILSRPESLEMVWWQMLQGQPHWACKEGSGVTDLLPHALSSLAATAVRFSPHASLQSEVAPCNDTSCHTNLGSDSDGVCVPAVMTQARVTSALALSAFLIVLANNLLQPWVSGSFHYSTEHLQIPEKYPLCRREWDLTNHRSSTAWQVLHFLPISWKLQAVTPWLSNCKPARRLHMLFFYQWLACCGKVGGKHFWKIVILVSNRGGLSHGRNHLSKPMHWIVTESELKYPAFILLKCCCCLSSVSFLLSALLQIFLTLCFFVVFFKQIMQNCFLPSLIASNSFRSLISHLILIDSFPSPEFHTIKTNYCCRAPCMFWAEIVTY